MSVILGIDPGSRTTGYGVIATGQAAGGRSPRYVASGCIRLEGQAIAPRLQTIYTSLQQLIEQFQPDELAIEQVGIVQHRQNCFCRPIHLGSPKRVHSD